MTKLDWYFGLLCSATALFIATLPHWWTGNPTWMADYDDFAFYRPLGVINAQNGGWSLQDPVTGGPSYYQALPVRPILVLVNALHLPPQWVGILWRAVPGTLIGLLWYILFRQFARPLHSMLFTLVMLADPGVLHGQLGYLSLKSALLPYNIGKPFYYSSLPQWRIHNPVISWPFWMAFLLMVGRTVQAPTRFNWILSGLLFGVQFYVYFYYWTAAAVGLTICGLLNHGQRLVFWKVLLLGSLIGAPSVVMSANFKASTGTDWMQRTDKFVAVERFSELLIPKITLAAWLVATVGVWRFAPHWRWLSYFSLTALLLMNQSIITRLILEDFHWYYALGVPLCLLEARAATVFLERSPRWGTGLLVVFTIITVIAGSCFFIRAANRCQEAKDIQQAVRLFQDLNSEVPIGQYIHPMDVLAGPDSLQYAAANEFGARPLAGYSCLLSPISDDEYNHRVALNDWLQGQSREPFLEERRKHYDKSVWGVEARSAEAKQQRLLKLAEAWDDVASNPIHWIKVFKVQLVIVPEGRPTNHLTRWKLAGRHAGYSVFVRGD